MTEGDPRDLELEAAYRETAREAPPRSLDDRILAAAHRAVGARPAAAGRGWTQRWRVPLSLAATVVLSATVTLMVYESENAPPPLAPSQPAVNGPAAAPPAASSIERARELPKPAERKADEAAGARLDQRATGDSSRAASRAPEGPAEAEMRRQAPEAEHGPRGIVKPSAVAPEPAPFPADARAGAAPSAAEDRAIADRPTGRAAAQAPALAAKPSLVTPEDWVAEIRRLKREGRTDEAAKRLAELRERFPSYVLPDDLR